MPKSHSLGVQALVLALLTGTSSALAGDGTGENFLGQGEDCPWWVGFSAGLTSPIDVDPTSSGVIEFDNGYLFAGSVGYRLGNLNKNLQVGVELEGLFTEADVDEDGFVTTDVENVSTSAFLVNGVLDWRWSEKVSLSLSGGLGYAKTDFNTFSGANNVSLLDDEDDGLAAQGKLGFVYDLGGNYSWSLGYRYFRSESLDALDASNAETFDLTNEVHSFEFGVQYGR